MTVRSERGIRGVRLLILVSKCFSQLSAIAKYRDWAISKHSHMVLTGRKSQTRMLVWPSSGEAFLQAADGCLLAVSSTGGGDRSSFFFFFNFLF